MSICSSLQLTKEYQWLDDETKNFSVSLKSVFDNYVTVNYPDEPVIFPEGNIIISEVGTVISSAPRCRRCEFFLFIYLFIFFLESRYHHIQVPNIVTGISVPRFTHC